jgi:hypothetical protein
LALRRHLREDPAALERLRVHANDVSLPLTAAPILDQGAVRQRPPLLPAEPLEQEFAIGPDAAGAFELRIEYLDGFVLHGTLQGPPDCAGAITLYCNDTPLEAALLCDDGANHVDQTTEKPGAVSFEIELPGYVWQHADADGGCSIQLAVGEARMPAVGVRLTRQHAASWLTDIAEGYFGDAQYLELLGLEHLHYLGGACGLAAPVAEFFQERAARYGLEQYVDVAPSADDQGGLPADIDDEKLAIWEFLRRFNEQMPAWQGREDELLASLLGAGDVTGHCKRWALYSLVPLFCRLDRFGAIGDLLSALEVNELAAGKDEWRVSLALPFLIEANQVERAAQLLSRLPETEPLWLNTECVAYVARHVARIDPRLTSDELAEKIAYGVIDLLDRLRLDYWSRLHDVHLIDALACWFEQGPRWNIWLRRALEAAAVRVYGLCPPFWERVEEPLGRHAELFPRLVEAQDHYEQIATVLWSRNEWDGEVTALRNALGFFRRHENAEAAAVAREFVCNRLSSVGAGEGGAKADVELLTTLSDSERVRLAALPSRASACRADSHPGLCEILTELGEVSSRAPKYPAQRQAARDLAALRDAIARGADHQVRSLAEQVRQAAAQLRSAACGYIGVDLLADVCLLLHQAGRPMAADVYALRRYGAEALAVLRPGEWPPASLLAAMAKMRLLVASAGADALRHVVEDWQSVLSGGLGELIEASLQPPPAPARRSAPGTDQGDTLVVIYSCRKYLETRIPAIRSTWAADLKARGIPYVILVGDGDDRVTGDVLQLDVSDRYEDLPAKSLKLFEWVRTHTDFQYVIKVDDDVYLDVDEFFDALSHRKYHYYGRILHRSIGTMDRTWHQGKSQGQRARRAIDKSPEPAVYADGATAYCLSRLALECLHRMAATLEGKRLIACSYMEDKLVGDLLRLGGMQCADEDYYTYVQRRTFGRALPISMWVNSFFPSASTPTKLVHLDTESQMALAHHRKNEPGLLPKRLWPTHEGPSLQFNGNQLELLTPVDKAALLLQQELVVIAVVRNEQLMLPHFLQHYRQLGVKTFIFIDNASDDGTRERLLEEPDVVLYSADTEYRYSHYGVSWQKTVLGNHCIGKWALLVDADELLVYPGCEAQTLAEYVRGLERDGYDSARVMMIDMYPYGDLADGDFEKAPPFAAAGYFDARPVIEWRIGGGYYGNTRNFTSALRHRLIPTAEPHAFMSQKYALLRYMPWMHLNQGLHNVGNIRPADGNLCFAHFKYHAGFKRKIDIEVRRKQHFDGAREYRRYREMVAEGSGGFGSAGLSVRYENSLSFAQALAEL